MSGSVNKAILVGNLVADPEVRRTQNGDAIATLRLATNETWRDKASGERREKSEFHRVVLFNERLVELAEKYLRKGAKIYVEGALTTRKWQDQQGQDRYSTEIVLSRFKGELTMLDSPSEKAAPPPERQVSAPRRFGDPSDDLNDSIPFVSMELDRDIILPQNRKPRGARL